MQKKIVAVIAVVLLAGFLGLLYNSFFAPEGVEGEKEVFVQVIMEKEDIDETFNYNTDHEFLNELLEEEQEELGVSFQTFDSLVFVSGMMGYEAGGQEFFYFTINGEEAEVGVKEVPLRDGDIYTFELTTF